jgi:hypothetical protein
MGAEEGEGGLVNREASPVAGDFWALGIIGRGEGRNAAPPQLIQQVELPDALRVGIQDFFYRPQQAGNVFPHGNSLADGDPRCQAQGRQFV